ncbi:hypothetical protein HUA78_12920 [Myxococcus sp. CA033]|uniref:hypothetical protein n=1 Tax=Myxococcus sp. CA033 TaxID=2741516 RepID=UPI00157B5CBA|nr:hypothetical protein [Myxococcus sp. CA033]NTX35346.1 hypothetical protein [Myxococcus sp. CA033]
MKVDAEAPADSTPTKQRPDAERFQRALQEAPQRSAALPASRPPAALAPLRAPPPTLRAPPRAEALIAARATSPVLATTRGALASPERLAVTRQAMHAESSRLGSVRGEAQASNQERTEHRLTDLLARELSREPRVPTSAPLKTESTLAPPEAPRLAASPESTGTEGRMPVTGAGSAARSEAPPTSRVDSALELIERIEVFVKSQRPALSISVRGTLDATVEVERTGPREVVLRIQGHHGPVPTQDVARLRDALEARGLKLRSLRAG